MVQPDGDADSRAMEERKGKELEHADSSEVEQQATATAASISTERGSRRWNPDRVDLQV